MNDRIQISGTLTVSTGGRMSGHLVIGRAQRSTEPQSQQVARLQVEDFQELPLIETKIERGDEEEK